jgi:putrescine transport system substrate-binding protein
MARRGPRALHCLLLLLCVLRAPGSAAAEDPVLNVFNWADYMAPDTIAGFERETGIRVNYDIYDSSELVDTRLLAGRSGYDVVFHSANYAARLIPIGVFLTLDQGKLRGLANLDPRLRQVFERYDPGLRHGVPYTWGTTGFAYDVEKIRSRMPDAPLDSADLMFRPEIVSRFADYGISLLDSATDVLPMALLYLGHDANSVLPAHLAEAERLLLAIRPSVRYFSNQRMLVDLPAGEVCIAMSWSGDYAVARERAREAGIRRELGFVVPAEGVTAWFDAAYIPADAPHPGNAHRFLAWLLRPEVIAAVTNAVGYANANAAATGLVREDIRNDPAIYPDERIMRRLQTPFGLEPKSERLRSRAWSRVKAGIPPPAEGTP